MSRACLRTLWLAVTAAAGSLAFFALPASLPRAGEQKSDLPSPQDLLDKLPASLKPAIPGDVDVTLKKKLEKAKKFAEVQELFDIFSWQSFVALNWPVDKDGRPRPNLNDPGRKQWDTFKPSDEVFLPHGARPEPYEKPRQNKRYLMRGIKVKPEARVLRSVSAVNSKLAHDQPVFKDITQAFSQPIWDQNGFMVRYEIAINRDEFQFIVDNELYNLNGQAAYWQKGKPLMFPVNDLADSARVGAMELKLAWKVLCEDKGDLPGRFVTIKGHIFTGPRGTDVKEVTLGLVGMHIAHKTRSSPQWIWSTFAHVDNIQSNPLETFNGKPIPSLFSNPNKEYLPVNVSSQALGPYIDGKAPTQILQLQPIPKGTEAVNQAARAYLKKDHSVLQYYELLGTQWPTDPSAPPAGPSHYPDSVTNKSGGKPVPTYLVNPIAETYFQKGNQAFSNQEENGPQSDKKQIFGTESCVGCHSSAPIATGVSYPAQGPPSASFGSQLSGDFSWLLSQRAQPRPKP
jgi:hypothetical protein